MTDSTSANNSASVLQDNSASVDRISVKIPPFWPNDLEIWFLQVENQFALVNITSDAAKFNYIVANLETVYISELRDTIVSPPATERLLKHEELGDRRPSQFLRHLQSLAGTTVPDNIVRSLWLGRLPSSTQAILAAQAKASLDAVAELADTISEAIAPGVHISGASNARESTIDKLTAELAEMKIQLANLSQAQAQPNTYRRNRSNSRGRPYPRDRSYSRELHDKTFTSVSSRSGGWIAMLTSNIGPNKDWTRITSEKSTKTPQTTKLRGNRHGTP
ncbi:uncharacterized protein LOC126885384 [Diabrotica virgifera virgifera]|uniref:DUF7041 domain-containing protein n=1 Tax=Diabrotica virgifera virgifera TaxID=50390 RepID=A0ABM5KCI3_DIAVI|nr:uncharacterized protein LOC126885384 [Diabrotica virgifera virgifera]